MISPAFWITTRRRRSGRPCGELVGVVQAGALDGRAGQRDGLRSATGVSLPVLPTWTVIPTSARHGLSASYLKAIAQRGLLLRDPEPRALVEVVDLDHQAVGLEVERVPPVAPTPGVLDHLVDRVVPAPMCGLTGMPHALFSRPSRARSTRSRRCPRHSPRPCETNRSRRGRRASGSSSLSEPAVEFRGLAKGVSPAARRSSLSAEQLGVGHVDLAADLEQRDGSILQRRSGILADGLQVGGDVVAALAVAAGRPQDGRRRPRSGARRDAVDLQLDDVGEARVIDAFSADGAHSGIPLADLVVGVRVVDREHRHDVLDRLERRDRLAADALGRAVGGDELGVLGLDGAQLVDQRVVVVVGDLPGRRGRSSSRRARR